MPRYEYKVVPAPKRGKSAKGIRGKEERFAHALSELMNELGAEGWDYVRADTLPSEERSGLAARSIVYQNMLVFRRERDGDDLSVADGTGPLAPIPVIEQKSQPLGIIGALKSRIPQRKSSPKDAPDDIAAE